MEEQIAQLVSHLKGIWKYRWHAVATAWIVAVAGGIAVFLMPDKYQASARVYVDTQSILKPLLSGMTSVPNVEQQVAIMSRTLLSRPNLERLVRMVDLDVKAKTPKEQEAIIDKLSNDITLGGNARDNIYTLAYSNRDPRLAKEVVRSLLTIFVEGGIGDKKKESEKAVNFIEEQIKMYEDKLIAAENALKDFKLKNSGLVSRQGGDYGAKLFEATENLNQAKLELREAEQARNAIKRQISGDDAQGADSTVTPAIANAEIDSRIQALNKNLDSLQMQYTDEHPDIVSTKRLIAQLEARKLEEAKTKKPADPGINYSPMLQQLNVSLAAAEAKVASMRARVEEYAARVNHLKALNVAMPEVEAQLAQLNRDYQINKDNYEKLLGRREAAKLSGELTATTEMMTFRVVDPPMVPLKPSAPNRPLLLAGVLLGSLLAGVGAAFLMSRVRPTFVTQYSLREATGLPILGAVAMHWTEQEKARRRKGLHAFSLACMLLVVLYSGLISTIMLKA
ncbi:XrtA system polysaccharide chain length determinant [Noviherbaspirillum massiliense]|uniref:XrtA system polysaccharide chain length determinant n=1 Tax=Noviherbaspirillum massiliense TaxID=1465823 RepID=UPI0002E248A5|nr:XrtA system polysaccharide chain length determinant [Noviherbaspirillum massiliense]